MWKTLVLLAVLVPSANDETLTYCHERADVRSNFAAARIQGYAEDGLKSHLVATVRQRNLDEDPDNDITLDDLKLVLEDVSWAFAHRFTPAATFDVVYEDCKRSLMQYVEDGDEGGK